MARGLARRRLADALHEYENLIPGHRADSNGDGSGRRTGVGSYLGLSNAARRRRDANATYHDSPVHSAAATA
ncbi:MAG: hypothetical protein ACRDPW_06540, partial [Mycobacteriales bacterium]